MGKNRHTKDRLYLSASEWKQVYGGKKTAHVTGYKALPYDCCALTFAPFETPVCTRKGAVYDVLNILPYLAKHGVDPVTGSPLSRADLIELHFFKNDAGKYHCPVLFKEFNNHTHIVAIATSGNVFSYKAVEELNIKAKNWVDLVTGEKFKKSDIITLQDPQDLKLREYSNFHHARNPSEKDVHAKRRKVEEDAQESSEPSKSNTHGVTVDPNTAKLLTAIKEKAKTSKGVPLPGMHSSHVVESESKGTVGHLMHRYTTGAQSGSLTSTSMDPVTRTEYATVHTSEAVRMLRWDRIRRRKEKGYVRMHTNLGMMNLELHFDYFPRTCENFLTLAKTGYYDGLEFHRLIKGFMVQGGDPTGTGRGGKSIWETPFKDEFHPQIKHAERGVLAMANSGPNTNNSQFYLTFKACPHLDNKHTVFGKVVGGEQVLDAMESIPTNPKTDRPVDPIRIVSFEILEDPVQVEDEATKALHTSQTSEGGSESRPLKRTRASAVVDGDPGIVKPGDSLFNKRESVAEEVETHEVVKLNGEWKAVPKPSASETHSILGSTVATQSKAMGQGASRAATLTARASAQPRHFAKQAMKKKKGKGGFGDFSSW